MITEDRVESDTITINAPAELVWDIIVDFDSYHLWNRFCPDAKAELKIGSPVVMQVDLGNGPQEQVEYITEIEAPHRITWSMENKPGDPIRADRTQVITAIDDSSCTYVSIDQFAGDMVPAMMEAMAEAVERGFNLCARCLKERAESLHQSASS